MTDVEYGKTIGQIRPANPIKPEYVFSGWDKSDDSQVTGNITVIATWSEDLVDVWLDRNYEEEPIPEDILTFTANSIGSKISLNKVGEPDDVSLEYYDGSWHDYVIGSEIQIPANGSVYLRATGENEYFSGDSSNYFQFSMSGKIDASGNI